MEQQMGEGLTTQGDRHPYHPGEIAEADLAGLMLHHVSATKSSAQWPGIEVQRSNPISTVKLRT